MANFPILSWITLLPILGMVIILFIPKNQEKVIKGFTLLITSLQVVLSIIILTNFNYSKGGIFDPNSFQFIEKFRWIDIAGLSWIGRIKIDYYLGIDGLSVPLVLLTAIITFIATLSSFSINKSVKGYFAMFLLLDTGMMGVFVALDFFLFYIFWELMLLPMYFLIGVWGGPRREYAAIKFFLYTLFGSVLMLLAILALYFTSEPHTFDMTMLIAQSGKYGTQPLAIWPFNQWGWGFQHVVWMALFIGFAIKIPAFPFHTWLPDAHVEAPTAISVILAGVLLKMGTYGILRVNYTMFPEITKQLIWYIALFGMINIIYGALTAMAQKDYKKLIAYSSISHMGFVLLGMASLNTLGISGAVLQMFNHGTITAMLFLIVGVIYDRAHTRDIDGFGGLAVQMPIYTGFTTLAFFAAIGLPGLSGFISEAFVFLGSFGFETIRVIAIISTLGILLGAGYMLWTLQRIYLGKLNEKWATLSDMDLREYAMLVPLSLIIIFLGIYPSAMLDLMNTSVNSMVQFLSESSKFLGSIN